MNPEPDRNLPVARSVDDEQLGSLVRTVVDDWRMPPQRLDQPTWREGVRTGAGRRRRWPMRLAGPAAAALVATVVLAVTAVWLNAPRGDQGVAAQSPSASGTPPSASGTPPASSGPARTPLPRLLRNGELPSVTQVMVRAEGEYRLADLATGTLGDDGLGSYSGPTALIPRADGGWLCVCGKWTTFGLTGPTELSMSLASIDAQGGVVDRTEIRTVHGTLDPDQPSDLQFQVVDGGVGVAPDGRTAFFTWMAREGAGWTSGIDAIDVASGTVIGSRALPVDQPSSSAGKPITRNAATVKVSVTGDRIMLASFWFVEDPNDPQPPFGRERWTAPVVDGTVGEVIPLDPVDADGCGEYDFGLIDSSTYYLLCGGTSGDMVLERIGLDGSAIGETRIPRVAGEFSGTALTARSGDWLYIWDPVSAVMNRVDLGTGELTVSPPASAAATGPLEALGAIGRGLGRWIAPSALAKLLLDPGLVISPDGTRVYAIGVSSAAPTGAGSTGVYAFDAASLGVVGHWEPTAEFTSIAVSADGRFVYASAQGGVDADGVASHNGASVTVFDASDGSVRLIAGELGSSDLWFANPTLE